jgi:hypothetical protein
LCGEVPIKLMTGNSVWAWKIVQLGEAAAANRWLVRKKKRNNKEDF